MLFGFIVFISFKPLPNWSHWTQKQRRKLIQNFLALSSVLWFSGY